MACSQSTGSQGAQPTGLQAAQQVAGEYASATEDSPFAFLDPIVAGLSVDLSEDERKEAVQFIHQHADIFSKHEFDLGRTTLLEHRINTGDARPVRQGLRRHPQVHLELIDEQVGKMLQSGIIEEACSPWASNIVVVSKHDSTPRITLDYRALNLRTYKDSYPLPNIADCLDAFKGSSYFGLLDLRSSFYQVPLAESDRDKTGFITRRGQFRFRSMPMGLCNSPGTFQRLMDLVLKGLTWESVLVYIDDIVVYARSFGELKERLEGVFNRLRAANLKLKPTKCRLFQREIVFLGHRISQAGVAMDDSKVEAIVSWPVPKNLRELREFLGLAGYYRRFILQYSTKAAPLHELTRKDQPFVWGERQQSAFELLKQHLASGPVLAMSQDEGEFVLDVDASGVAAGAVLQQRQEGVLKVIGYASRAFQPCEQRYCVTRKEMAALVFGLKHYRQYLLGRRFLVRTDHAALTFLRTAGELVGQQARWIDFIEQFDCEFQHRSGTSHANADALSRRPCDKEGARCRQCWGKESGSIRAVQTRAQTRTQPAAVATQQDSDEAEQVSPLSIGVPEGGGSERRRKRRRAGRTKEIQTRLDQEGWTTEFLLSEQKADADIGPLRSWVAGEAERPDWDTVRAESPSLKAYWQQWGSFTIRDGLLYRALAGIKDQEESLQLMLPKSLHQTFLRMVHEGVAGHLGARKTQEHVKRRVYWFHWRRDTELFCRKCDRCNEYHRGRPPKQGLLRPMVLGAPTERWACDLTGPHPRSTSGHVYILTAICAFSKYAVLIPLRDKCATTVAQAIMENVFLKFGAGEILTDGGGEFRNELLGELCRLMGVYKVMTTAYKASTNAVAERSHATFHSMLAKCVSTNQRDWSSHLAYVAFCYNASVHESTGYSPHFLMHGTEPRWDVDLELCTPGAEPCSVNDYAALLLGRLGAAHELARESLKTAATRMKDWYDRKVHTQTFEPGDQVYVLNLRLYQGRTPKWVRRYSDIAVVEQRINGVTYKLSSARWKGARRIVHVDKLKLRCRASEREDHQMAGPAPAGPSGPQESAARRVH